METVELEKLKFIVIQHLSPELAKEFVIPARIDVTQFGEFCLHIRFTGHWFSGDDVRLGHTWSFGGFDAEGLPCLLCTQPKGQRGDLHGSGINVDAVQVMRNDQLWDLSAQVIKCFEIFSQNSPAVFVLWAIRIVPGFLINPFQ